MNCSNCNAHPLSVPMVVFGQVAVCVRCLSSVLEFKLHEPGQAAKRPKSGPALVIESDTEATLVIEDDGC